MKGERSVFPGEEVFFLDVVQSRAAHVAVQGRTFGDLSATLDLAAHLCTLPSRTTAQYHNYTSEGGSRRDNGGGRYPHDGARVPSVKAGLETLPAR